MSAAQDRVYTFFVVKQPGQPERILVWDTQDISVGRSPENDLILDHAEMSRRHAVFTRTPKSHVVKNHSTSNATYVNDQPVKTAPLKNKDRVKIAEVEMIFYQVAKNPATLDAKLEYASQLKDFTSPADASASSPDATMLGLMDSAAGEDDFVVGPARDFAYDLHGIDDGSGQTPPPAARDLDAELAQDPVLGNSPKPVEREPWSLDDPAPSKPPQPASAAATDTLSVTVELAGLTPDQRRAVESLLGKVIALPALKIRLKGNDVG